VVDVARLAVRVVAQAEGNSSVTLVVVAVVDLDLDAAVAGEVGAIEAVGREGLSSDAETSRDAR